MFLVIELNAICACLNVHSSLMFLDVQLQAYQDSASLSWDKNIIPLCIAAVRSFTELSEVLLKKLIWAVLSTASLTPHRTSVTTLTNKFEVIVERFESEKVSILQTSVRQTVTPWALRPQSH